MVLVQNIFDFANNPVDVTGKTRVVVKFCKVSSRSRTQGHLKLSQGNSSLPVHCIEVM